MTASRVNGSENKARSGAQTLLLLSAPLNVSLLRALAAGPKRQSELRRIPDSPAQTTLRAQLSRLVDVGAIEKHRRNRFPGVLEYELTASGRDLLFVVEILGSWLDRGPDGPLPAGSNAARTMVKTLAEGWSTTMMRALAAGPLSLTELDRVIAALNYPSLERRLGAMRLAGLVEPRPGTGRGTPYAVTDWLRMGIAPLAAASRWERRHRPQATAPLSSLDVETAFLLAVPLLQLSSEFSGECRLAAELSNGSERRFAGLIVEVRKGRIASYATRLKGNPDAWALGSGAAWLSAVIERDFDSLELGGDSQLADALLTGLHESLFGSRPRELDVRFSIRDDGSN